MKTKRLVQQLCEALVVTHAVKIPVNTWHGPGAFQGPGCHTPRYDEPAQLGVGDTAGTYDPRCIVLLLILTELLNCDKMKWRTVWSQEAAQTVADILQTSSAQKSFVFSV